MSTACELCWSTLANGDLIAMAEASFDQVMPEKDAAKRPYNPFDLTKVRTSTRSLGSSSG